MKDRACRDDFKILIRAETVQSMLNTPKGILQKQYVFQVVSQARV